MISKLDIKKKMRERELLDEFISICPDFAGWEFFKYMENPDAVYKKEDKLLGFDSIIISDDQASVQCVYSPDLCKLSLPAKIPHDKRLNQIEVFFANKLFTHLRHYSLPTILVFSIVDTESTSLEDIVTIAKKFSLPKLEEHNIAAYYICTHTDYVKIASS
jgi:hypothetical protein